MSGNLDVNNNRTVSIFTIILSMFWRGILGGVFISIAGWCYLSNPVVGMFLFCVGLIAVIKYKLWLFTGTVGLVPNFSEYLLSHFILLGNIIGCAIVGVFAMFSPNEIYTDAMSIIQLRLSIGWLHTLVLSVGCGILMSFAVIFAKRDSGFSDWLPLLFAVPAFILCGFPHCVADAFYSTLYLLNTPDVEVGRFIAYYASIVAGNTIGCTLHRLFIK